MKKKILYLASLCLAFAFTACSSDDGGTSAPPPVLTSTGVSEEALQLNLPVNAPLTRIVFSETRRAILGPFVSHEAAKQRRAKGSGSKYVVSTYTKEGNTYTVHDADNNEYWIVEVADKTSGATTNVKIRLKSGAETEETVFDGDASVGEKVEADAATTAICREWIVATTRLSHKGDVKAAMQFEKGVQYEDENGEPIFYDPASLNDILRYAKSVATINEEFDEETVISSIEFTADGTFCMFFENGKHYIGQWEWADKAKGYIHYWWDDEVNMGNKFENGEAVFDIRQFKQKGYYTFTMGASIEDDADRAYEVELSFFMEERQDD